jgi:hypothetical protein
MQRTSKLALTIHAVEVCAMVTRRQATTAHQLGPLDRQSGIRTFDGGPGTKSLPTRRSRADGYRYPPPSRSGDFVLKELA